MEKDKLWYLEEGCKKIDRNFYFDYQTAIRKALEVANFKHNFVRVYSYSYPEGKEYVARVHADGTVVERPEGLYKEIDGIEKSIESVIKQKSEHKIQEVKDILKSISKDIF
jgi:hypothetical protein